MCFFEAKQDLLDNVDMFREECSLSLCCGLVQTIQKKLWQFQEGLSDPKRYHAVVVNDPYCSYLQISSK